MHVKHFDGADRGMKDTGWLRSHFFFSFADFQDPTLSSFGTLVAFNDDFLDADKGFGIHPHKNMEIISVMLKGSMSHKDSLGYDTVVHAAGVQIMSAGSGIRHEEYNVGGDEVNFLQIWIQPKLQNIDPRYQFRSFPPERRQNTLQTIVSGEEGAAHCWINQNARLSLGLYDAGADLGYTFSGVNKCLFIFTISGAISVSGYPVEARSALGIWGTEQVSIHCTTASEFLVIETPINQK